MADPEHVEIVRQGPDAIREWRKKHPDGTLDLERADLSRAFLQKAILSGANLHWANLSNSHLIGADLSGADLRNADLSGAHLINAQLIRTDLRITILRRADLSNADLSTAHLMDADLTGAELRDSMFKGAQIGWTVFADVDLSVAKDLETLEHIGPSSVAVDTLAKSQGRIPDEFLRGCGFTPWQIMEAKLYDPTLTAAEINELQYKIFDLRAHGPLYIGGVFISYSHADADFVDKVFKRLQKAGASAWLDRHDMVAGPLQKQVSRAIRLNHVVLLVLSETSIKSDWVENELDMARRKEKGENRDVLCPVALDESWKSKAIGLEAEDLDADDRALWRTLTHKNILDFSGWQTEAFEGQFEKLLRGMKIYYEPKKRPVQSTDAGDSLADTPEYLEQWARSLVKAGKADARIALEQYQSIATDKRVSKADREIAANRAKAIRQFL